MSLGKLVTEVTDAHEADGIINRHEAITAAVPRVMADPEMTEVCVRGHLSRMIASNVKGRRREASAARAGQGSIFGLRDAHVLDDGEGSIKHTRALSRIEFQHLIRVREDQVEADMAYLGKLRAAATETARLWDRNPDWTWGQVEDAYQRQRVAA